VLAACSAASLAVAAGKPPAPSAEQIVEKHVTARGGLRGWHTLQTLAVSGKIDAGTGDSIQRSTVMSQQGAGASGRRAQRAAAAAASARTATEQVQLPFRLEIKKPHKSRFELDFAGRTAVQVYDGERGWKFRPYLNRDDVEPFTAEEAKTEATRAQLEDPLLDYAAKGTRVELEGTESVEGHDAYRLRLTHKDGDVQHVWIDAHSFLDVKSEGIPHRMDGKIHNVFVYQKDFRTVKGLVIPYLYVTEVEGYQGAHRMVVESVTVNPAIDDSRFAKPQVPVAAAPATAAAPSSP
jgi:outer membrane lipoprotein-sorting protein